MKNDPSRVRVSGPLAVHAVAFGEELIRRGYPPERAARHVQLLAHLSRWLDKHGLSAAAGLTEQQLAEFLRVRRDEGYTDVPSLGWVITLLSWVPGLIVAPMPEPAADTLVEGIIKEYCSYLVRERGLAAPTVRGYVDVARGFLSHLEQGLELSSLTAGEVRTFVLGECRGRHVGSARVLVPALRSLLRFLSLEGYTAHPLAGAVPAASTMVGGLLPRALAPEVLVALLASCDSTAAVGRRDFAILTVLSRLGLRAGEVARLELGDFDWHHGEVVVHGKGSRQDRLPLPVDVGEAVVAYLAEGRPRVECRAVFLRVHAPPRSAP